MAGPVSILETAALSGSVEVRLGAVRAPSVRILPGLACVVGLLGGFGVAGCDRGQTELQRVEGSGFFEPAQIEFGIRPVGTAHRVVTGFRNSSGAEFRIRRLDFDPIVDVFEATRTGGSSLIGQRLRYGQLLDVEVTFRPPVTGSFETTLFVQSEAIEVPLRLTGRAEDVAPGRPGLSPERLAFAPVPAGAVARRLVRLNNDGDTEASLVLVQIPSPFSVVAADGAALSMPVGPLVPGAGIDVEVMFASEVQGSFEATAQFTFDTGQTARLSVTAEALRPGDVSCSPRLIDLGEVPRGISVYKRVICQVTGGPFTLQRLSLSKGSSDRFSVAGLPDGIGPGRAIGFDVGFQSAGSSGRHRGSIELSGTHGVTTSVFLMAETVPPKPFEADLMVSMVWNTPETDLDLHVVRQPGAPFGVDDCYFEAKNPDWGRPEIRNDDPVLDLDDRNGLGPETMDLLAAADGVYDLYVHFFGFDRPSLPATHVEVKIMLRDGTVVVRSAILATCGEMWHLGRYVHAGHERRFEPSDGRSTEFQANASPACR